MPTLTIRHMTAYRYRQPVAFGEHRMMLRPRDASDQTVLKASIEISPEPTCLRFVQDAFGNHLGIAEFSGRSKELSFESVACVEHSPPNVGGFEIEEFARTFPFDYGAGLRKGLWRRSTR
jgi:transglutaminase-like putative cysteine protease